jgi:hypothetical protein
MSLDREDFSYLDGKFNAVHGRIDQLRGEVMAAQEKCESRITQTAEELHLHRATPCPDMKAHVEEKHNLAKTLGLVALVSTIAVGALKALMWLFSVKDTVPW